MSILVELFPETGFGGEPLPIREAGDVRDLRTQYPDYWTRIRSIRVNENAVLRAFSETDFRHEEMTCLPGEERDRLNSNNFSDRIKSFKVYDANNLQRPY